MKFILHYLFFCFALCAPQFSAKAEDPVSQNLGPLKGILIEKDKKNPYIVFLHGWGGDGLSAYEALKSKIERSESLKGVNWIFPDAPKGSWFQIEAIDPSNSEPLYDVWQETLKPTRKKLDKMISALGLKANQVIWAGFSQGGITAIDYVVHSKSAPRGLIVDSGMYYQPTDLKKEMPHLKGVKFSMAHDPNDEMLPLEKAKEAEKLLKSYEMVGDLKRVKGHEIHPKFIESAIADLSSKTANLKLATDCNRSFAKVRRP